MAWAAGALSTMSVSADASDIAAVDSTLLTVRSADGAQAELAVTCPTAAHFGVLWLPALGVSARNYRKFATALASHRVATALHEWRGAGSSRVRASRTSDWGYRELLEWDIPASLEAARRACPGLPWVVAGHSLGGQFACLFGALNPHSVAAIAFAASGSPYWRTFAGSMRLLLRQVAPIVTMLTAAVGYYPGKRLGFAGREARGLMREWARSAKTGRYANYVPERDSEQALASYAGTVLAIRLTADRLSPPASIDWLLAKFSLASIERSVLTPAAFASAEATHFSWLQDPDPVAATLADTLRRVVGNCEPMASVPASSISDLRSAPIGRIPEPR